MAWHLVLEIQGKATYDEDLYRSAVESKALEGMGESAPQLLLQSYILLRTLLLKNGPERVLGQSEEYFFSVHCKNEDAARGNTYCIKSVSICLVPILCLQLAMSLYSFVNVLSSNVQHMAGRHLGNIKTPSVVHQGLFFLFAIIIFAYKLVFVGLLAFFFRSVAFIFFNCSTESTDMNSYNASAYEGSYLVCMYISAMAMFILTPIYNVAIHGVCLGWKATTLADGFLSSILPLNFILDEERATRRYMLAYTGNLLLQYASLASFGIG